MVKILLEEKYVSLHPLTKEDAGTGFNFGSGVRRRNMSRMGELL